MRRKCRESQAPFVECSRTEEFFLSCQLDKSAQPGATGFLEPELSPWPPGIQSGPRPVGYLILLSPPRPEALESPGVGRQGANPRADAITGKGLQPQFPCGGARQPC